MCHKAIYNERKYNTRTLNPNLWLSSDSSGCVILVYIPSFVFEWSGKCFFLEGYYVDVSRLRNKDHFESFEFNFGDFHWMEVKEGSLSLSKDGFLKDGGHFNSYQRIDR